MYPVRASSLRKSFHFVASCAFAVACLQPACAQDGATPGEQNDGGASYTRNEELLESIVVPELAHAPFSLALKTEWSRRMANGGTYTVVNSRPIKRDSQGRIYQERWTLSPKGSEIPSRMTWIQISNPIDHTLYECSPRQHACELRTLTGSDNPPANPGARKSGPLPGNRGDWTHEDLGADFFAGLPVHHYRDTTTIKAGVMGNDLPMSTVREYRFSSELGFNLTSVLDTPSLGRQTFTVTDVTTTEPEPHFFLPPNGYRIVDYRKGVPVAN